MLIVRVGRVSRETGGRGPGGGGGEGGRKGGWKCGGARRGGRGRAVGGGGAGGFAEEVAELVFAEVGGADGQVDAGELEILGALAGAEEEEGAVGAPGDGVGVAVGEEGGLAGVDGVVGGGGGDVHVE